LGVLTIPIAGRESRFAALGECCGMHPEES
jgi:hypothetical protein